MAVLIVLPVEIGALTVAVEGEQRRSAAADEIYEQLGIFFGRAHPHRLLESVPIGKHIEEGSQTGRRLADDRVCRNGIFPAVPVGLIPDMEAEHGGMTAEIGSRRGDVLAELRFPRLAEMMIARARIADDGAHARLFAFVQKAEHPLFLVPRGVVLERHGEGDPRVLPLRDGLFLVFEADGLIIPETKIVTHSNLVYVTAVQNTAGLRAARRRGPSARPHIPPRREHTSNGTPKEG